MANIPTSTSNIPLFHACYNKRKKRYILKESEDILCCVQNSLTYGNKVER